MKLILILQNSPSQNSISFLYSNSGLEEIDSFIPFLEKLPCLQTLDLSNNNLKELPTDLSMLSNLYTLNINDNPFEEFKAVVASLQTLPSLRYLSLNLQRNEEVELVLTSLPNLEVLNEQGLISVNLLEIDHEEDTEDEFEQKENVSPREQREKKQSKAAEESPEKNESPNNYENVFQQYKDINNNHHKEQEECKDEDKQEEGEFPDIKYEVEGEKSEQKGSQYEYQEEECDEAKAEDYEYEEEKADIVQESEMQSQGEPTISKVEKSDEQSESSVIREEINFEDLEEAVKIYDDFRSIAKRTNPSQDKVLEEEFEQKMSKLANALKKDLEENVSSELKSARVLKIRSEIIEITFQKMITAVPDKTVANIWNGIRREYNIIVRGLIKLVENSQSSNQGSDEEVVQARQELMEVKKSLEEERKKHQREKEKIKKQFAAERKELIEQISSLEKENQKYLSNIIKRSKMTAISGNGTMNNSSIQANSNKNLKKSLVISRIY